MKVFTAMAALRLILLGLILFVALLVTKPDISLAMHDDEGGGAQCVKVYDTLYGRLICS